MAGLLLASCQKPVARDDIDALSTQPDAPVAPALPQFAPPGVYYVVQAVRKETRDGISCLTPGTEVKLIRPGIYHTPIGDMPLDAHNLTNELDQAAAARTADLAMQANAFPKVVESVGRPGSANPAPTPDYLAQSRAARAAATAESNARTARFQLDIYRREEKRLRQTIEVLSYRVLVHSATADERSKLRAAEARIYTLERYIADLERKLQSALEQSARIQGR